MRDFFELPYGEETVRVPVRGAASVEVLRSASPTPLPDPGAALREGLERPVSSPPLGELVGPGDKITLVVSDITRRWMRQDLILPVLVEYLLGLGIRYEDIAVLVATGTHRSQTVEELAAIVSPELLLRVSVSVHDCDSPELVYLGTTSYGTPVRVSPLAVGRKVIGIGATIHHLMSGYSGGRKSFLPGVAGRDTIIHNHLHALSATEKRSSELIGVGRLEGNPLHLDMMEAVELVKPCFYINLLADGHGGQLDIVCGHWRDGWLKSCELANRFFGVPIAKKADVTLVSAGGYPKDINLYQSVKALLNGGLATREGGELLLLAQCRDGGGAPEFFDWIVPLQQGRLDEALREGFNIPGYIFYAAVEVIRSRRVTLLTELSPETLSGMGIAGTGDPEAFIKSTDFTGKTVYVMPSGGMDVPYVTG